MLNVLQLLMALYLNFTKTLSSFVNIKYRSRLQKNFDVITRFYVCFTSLKALYDSVKQDIGRFQLVTEFTYTFYRKWTYQAKTDYCIMSFTIVKSSVVYQWIYIVHVARRLFRSLLSSYLN